MEKAEPPNAVTVVETFGRFHWYQYILAILPSLVVTLVNINYVFTATDMDYRCRVPECDTWESTHEAPPWWPNTTVDKCTRPVVAGGTLHGSCSNASFAGVQECSEWIYETNNTIVAELNLACQPWKINLVGTIHNIGMLPAMVIAGWMSDRFGRKPAMIFCSVACIIGHIKAFAVNYYMYVIVEFLEAMVSGGTYLTASVYLIELGGKKNRIYAGVLLAYIIYFGECVFAGLGWLVPYWKTLIRIIYTPPLFFFAYIFLIRESPRWQILNGKSEEAKETLEKIAKINKVPINLEELRQLDDAKLKLLFNIGNYEVREGYSNIIKSREIIKRVIIASYARLTCGFVYYGLMINSVLLPGDKYVNFLLNTVMSFPGEIIAMCLMNRIGRKIPLIFGYLICGIFCMISDYLPGSWSKLICFLFSKMMVAACFTGITTYTMELYPTSVRGSLLAVGAVCSRLGSMLAPLTPMLLPISPVLPTLLFGASALATSLLLTLTPETKDLPLMDTIEQVEISTKIKKDMKKQAKMDAERNDMSFAQSSDTIVTKM